MLDFGAFPARRAPGRLDPRRASPPVVAKCDVSHSPGRCAGLFRGAMSDPFTISPSRLSAGRAVAPRKSKLIDLSLLVAVAGLFVWALLL